MRRKTSSRTANTMKTIPLQKQMTTMTMLGVLLDGNLSYIDGERESGPNGAKATFLRKGKEFLRGLGHDLGFAVAEVRANPAGIAVSGEVYLYGMWGEKNGLMIELSQMYIENCCLMYRTISHLNDYTGGQNRFLDTPYFMAGYYEELVAMLARYRNSDVAPLQTAA